MTPEVEHAVDDSAAANGPAAVDDARLVVHAQAVAVARGLCAERPIKLRVKEAG